MGVGALESPDPPLSDDVIRLRPLVEQDIGPIAAACQDERIQRFIPVPRPYHRADAAAYVARTAREWVEGTKAAFAIVAVDDPTGELLGVINLAIAGSAGNSGYWVAPGCRGLGLARRALELVTSWAFATLGLGVVILEIREENTSSISVAEAAGFHRAGRLDVNTATGKRGGLIFSRLAADP